MSIPRRPLTILIVTYQGDMAGSTNSILYLSRGLAARGHKVLLGVRPESYLAQVSKDSAVEVVPMHFTGMMDLANAREIARVVKERNVDVVDAQSARDRYTTIWARWLFGAKAKLVHTRRQMPKSSGNLMQNWLYTRGTDRIIAVSQGVKRELVRLGIPDRHVTVIPNGTPLEKYRRVDAKQTEALRFQHKIATDHFVIGCVSRRKDQHTLIAAVATLPEAVTVVFVGISEDEELRRLKETLALKQRLVYVGKVEDALDYYGLFDAFVLPSRMEGLSQSIMEAMVLGAPVIATDAGGNGELVIDGRTGLLVPPLDPDAMTDALRRLIADPDMRKAMAERARARILRDFTVERTVERHEQIFHELMGM